MQAVRDRFTALQHVTPGDLVREAFEARVALSSPRVWLAGRPRCAVADRDGIFLAVQVGDVNPVAAIDDLVAAEAQLVAVDAALRGYPADPPMPSYVLDDVRDVVRVVAGTALPDAGPAPLIRHQLEDAARTGDLAPLASDADLAALVAWDRWLHAVEPIISTIREVERQASTAAATTSLIDLYGAADSIVKLCRGLAPLAAETASVVSLSNAEANVASRAAAQRVVAACRSAASTIRACRGCGRQCAPSGRGRVGAFDVAARRRLVAAEQSAHSLASLDAQSRSLLEQVRAARRAHQPVGVGA